MTDDTTPPASTAGVEVTQADRKREDRIAARTWLSTRWSQPHPNEGHVKQLADYAAHLRLAHSAPAPAVPKEVAALIAELRQFGAGGRFAWEDTESARLLMQRAAAALAAAPTASEPGERA